MGEDGKYLEFIATNGRGEATGRLSAIKTRSGEVSIGVEEWAEGAIPFDSETEEAIVILTNAQFRAFIKWGKEVAG